MGMLRVLIFGANFPPKVITARGMAAVVKNKSPFEHFAYSKKRGVLSHNRVVAVQGECRNVEECNSARSCGTPNKDHSPSRVSETPESLISNCTPNKTLKCKNNLEKRKQRRKRRARISSSSDENCEPTHLMEPSTSEALFGDLPISKRSRNYSESEKSSINISATKLCTTEGSRTNGFCHRPRKLLFDDQSDEDCSELLRQKNSNVTRRRFGILENSSGSDEELSISVSVGGKASLETVFIGGLWFGYWWVWFCGWRSGCGSLCHLCKMRRLLNEVDTTGSCY